MPVTRTVSGVPVVVGTATVEPGSIFSSPAVSSVTAASTSRVSSVTASRATGQRPERRVLCSCSAEGAA